MPSAARAEDWSGWVEPGAAVSSDLNRLEASAFAPLWWRADRALFLQLDARAFEEDIREGNLALGYRALLPAGVILGGYASYDWRRSRAGNRFRQATFGLEQLGESWDARFNAYVPLSDAKAAPGVPQVSFVGDQLVMSGAMEVPLQGIDGEIGRRFFSVGGDGRPSHELWVYGGAFRFDGDDVPIAEAIAGPKARAEYRLGEFFAARPGMRLSVGGEFRTDDVRGDHWEGLLRLRIPFGAARTERPARGLKRRASCATPTSSRRRATSPSRSKAARARTSSGSNPATISRRR
jgi:hypothetical protein